MTKHKRVRNKISRMLRNGKVPLELIRQPVFQRTWAIASPRRNAPGPMPVDMFRRCVAARFLAWELITAWTLLTGGEDGAEDGDVKPWAMAVSKARKLGFI
ncbi:hypothetical protein [uncultured Cohaesibacter sp.]|uniref:hypothetical protein n=1 Tax=uncultured Cohaesibacter sp. TaxID=1002546 RepID=UPI0029C6F1B3|nr:hypothetical protein [uncultured Cohaesibacter sp.]